MNTTLMIHMWKQIYSFRLVAFLAFHDEVIFFCIDIASEFYHHLAVLFLVCLSWVSFLQAHFSRIELPVTDYVTDLKSVLDQSIRIIQAMIDICANSGWLSSTMTCMHLLQMVMQVAFLFSVSFSICQLLGDNFPLNSHYLSFKLMRIWYMLINMYSLSFSLNCLICEFV